MELVYPISAQYVSDWDMARAVAELIANALDEDPKTSVRWTGAELVISDRGPGWPEEALVLGYTTKNDSQIGQFGEGAKIAMLVIARTLGAGSLTIETTGFTVTPRLERRRLATSGESVSGDGLELLVVEITPNRRRVGTKITVRCDENTAAQAKRRFLHFAQRNYTAPVLSGRIVPGEGGRIYVGGVMVADNRDLVLSYDFPLADAKRLQNRDRSVLDGWEVERLITRALADCSDVAALEQLTLAALDGTLGRMENGAGTFTGDVEKRAWRRVRRRVFADQRVFWRGHGNQAVEQTLDLRDRGWREIECRIDAACFSSIMAALGIPDALLASGAHRSGRTTFVPRTQLTADERKVLSRQVRLLRKRYGADSVAVVKVFSHTDEVACAEGLYDPHNGHISVHRDVLCNEQHLAATLVHEVAHRIAHRRGVSWEDRTRGFENVLSELAGIALVPRRHV